MRALAAMLVVLAAAGPARAYDFDIYAETIGQGYQLRAADDTLVNRRRLTQLLGLEVYNLGPRDLVGRPLDQNQFYLSVSLRFDAELGDYASYQELPGHTVEHDFDPSRLEILYAYLGGRSLFGFLDFKLGRQITVDLFDYLAFDGLSVQLNTPFRVALEAWGGLAVSGEAPFDSPLYRVDGTALGGNPFGSLGARQESALEPTFGLALKTIGLRDVQARLSYERTISFTGSPRQAGEPSSGVIDEKVALTARGRLWGGRLIPWAGIRYNVLYGDLDEAQAGVRLQLGRHALQAEYVYAAPTFDGDSIWNVFGAEAFNDARLSYDVVIGKFRAYARGFVRLFGNDVTNGNGTDSGPAAAPASLSSGASAGGSLGARMDWRRGWSRLDAYWDDGYGGRKAGVDLAGRLALYGDLATGLVAEGRLSYINFRDDSRSIDHADSFGLQAGLRYTLVRGVTFNLAVEENVNRFYNSQFRLLALLDLSFWLGPRGAGYVHQQPGLF